MRLASLNIGTLTGKSREISAIMVDRGIDILCLQETRWTGGKSKGKARNIGDGCKLYYSGGNRPRNGVGICLNSYWQDKVIDVQRKSDRIIWMKLVTPGKNFNIISAYAPQQGCDQEEKTAFWNQLEEVLRKVPGREELIVAGDLNGHVGQERSGYERWHGGETLGQRNDEGESILDTARMYDLVITNTFFRQKEEHLLTFRSGIHSSVIDYILVRRESLRNVKNCKVIPGDPIATQHRLLVMDLKAKRKKEKRRDRPERIKWWKLKETEGREYIDKLKETIAGMIDKDDANWENTYPNIVELAKEELGVSKPGKYLEKESWWWNEDVQQAVMEKKEAFKSWKLARLEEDGDHSQEEEEYRECNKKAKVAVAKAKEVAYEDLYKDLEENGASKLYKLAKTRKRRSLDIDQMKFVKDENGEILSEDDDIKKRWKEYFDMLLNTQNRRKVLDRVDKIEGPIETVSEEEVKQQLQKMKKGKATGPDELPIEVVKMMDELGVSWMTAVLRDIQNKGIPSEWRKSRITPLYKQKGDPLSCSNYRGIKLLSHSLKLWERIVEARIRQIVKISDRQYGFQKGKSTVQPMFCLRMLQEKMREYQTDLHMVFVDLEKAYDTVPRELIWHCLRKKQVPEEYIRVIQDMYAQCTTSVNTAVGETEEVSIEVGLHQGSALSPFLFILIMDTITDDIDEDSPWTMLFADDLVLCDRDSERVEERLECWREHLEDAGLKLSRTKTEYMSPQEDSRKLRLKNYNQEDYAELPAVSHFKYLGTTIDREGGCGAEIVKRIGGAWDRWRDLTGVLCDKKIPTKLKDLLYKTAIRPTLLYGNETWPITQRQEERIEATEMRMLRYIHNVNWEDHVRNEDIRKEAKVKPISVSMRKRRLQWFGHVYRREEDEDIRKVADLKVDGRRKRGRPKQRWRDTIQSDLKKYGLNRSDVDDRVRWHSLIELGSLQNGHPDRTTAA